MPPAKLDHTDSPPLRCGHGPSSSSRCGVLRGLCVGKTSNLRTLLTVNPQQEGSDGGLEQRRKHLTRVHLARERVDDLAAAYRAPLDHARRQLELAIKEAVDDGVPQTAIAKATGYSRKHVQNILAGTPGRRSTDQPYLSLISKGTFDYEGGGRVREPGVPDSGEDRPQGSGNPPSATAGM